MLKIKIYENTKAFFYVYKTFCYNCMVKYVILHNIVLNIEKHSPRIWRRSSYLNENYTMSVLFFND